jgi:CubicO group peptidase (beta-lactamase class C family)
VIFISIGLWIIGGNAFANPPVGFDAYVERARATFDVPGMAVVLIEDGKVTFEGRFGRRRIDTAAENMSVGGSLQVLGPDAELGKNAAPAGGIASSAVDIARWLEVQLARGKLADGLDTCV